MKDTILPWLAATASKTGAVISGVTAIGGLYVALGGPVPASVAYVDGVARGLTITSLEDRRAIFRLSRYFIGNEEAALSKAVETLPESPNRSALERRRREIQDQLADINQDDDAARKKLQDLRR